MEYKRQNGHKNSPQLLRRQQKEQGEVQEEERG